MEKLQSVVLNSISEIDPLFWSNPEFKKSKHFSPQFLLSFETCNSAIRFKYIFLKREDAPVGLATIQIVELSTQAILKNILIPATLKRILNALFCHGKLRVMFCGNVFLSGEYGLYMSRNETPKEIVNAIGHEISLLIKKTKPLHAIFIKDFTDSAKDYANNFQPFGFSSLQVEPNMMLHLDRDWHTFGDYKNALKSKYRIKINRAEKKSSALLMKKMDYKDLEHYRDELQRLYQNTIDNASFNAQVLNIATYSELQKSFPEDFVVYAYFYHSKMVGFLSALFDKRSLVAHFIGLNYALNKDLSIYPRILNDYIRLGIERKSETVNLGRTASEIKSTIGAIPTNLTCYIKLKNPILNFILRPIIDKIQLKSFKQHQVFKGYRP